MGKKIPKAVLICAIICITTLEMIALLKGIDGTLMTIIVAIIAGIGGWSAPQLKIK